MRHLVGLLAFLGFGAAVQAQEIQGGYLGLALGSLRYDDSGENLGLPIAENTTSYRVIGGYQFNSVYSVEAGWSVSDTFGERFFAFDQNGDTVSLDIQGEYEIATLRVLAVAPFSNLNIFGGVGYYDASLEASFRFQSPDGIETQSGEGEDDGVTVVGGVQYEFRRFALRGEYEWFDTDDGVDLQSFNVGVLFRF